jgi:NCAIR mutase (PurE)-related protein
MAMVETHFNLDFARHERLGIGEALLCAGKTVAQIDAILDRVSDRGATMLLTRLASEAHAALAARHRRRLDYEALSRTGFFGAPATGAGTARVAVVAAGTSDLGVAREAVRTLAFNGQAASEIYDVGVAGLWRLTERLPDIVGHDVVVAVAGMDAALVSVLGGLVPGVLIAVPTSTGYGAARGGETALGASLASCAPGVSVVNIDNGYGAACAALRVLRLLDRSGKPRGAT